LGSSYYAREMITSNENIIAIIDLDMIGYIDQAPEELEIIGNDRSSDLADLFIEAANTYTQLATRKIIDKNIVTSDHSSFWHYGYDAILATEDYPAAYPYSHSSEDTIDKLNPEFLTLCTRASTATVATLAAPLPAIVAIFGTHWDDSNGNNNGFLNPGESVSAWINVINNSDEISGPIKLTMICLAGNQYISIQNNSASLPALLPGEQADNSMEPFTLTVKEEIPDFSELTCIAALDCDAPHSSGRFFYGKLTSYQWNESIISYPLDIEPDWTSDGNSWQWGYPEGQGGVNHGNPDPSSAFTGTNVLGTDLDGDYNANVVSTILSPVLDLTNARLTELHFKRWLNIEHPDFDKAGISVINEQGTHQIWENSYEITDNSWQTISLDISEFADGRDDVQIQFSLNTDNDWNYSGWNIDDIQIAGLAPEISTPTPTPTQYPEEIGISLAMSDTTLETGDFFDLTVDYWNHSIEDLVDVPVFVILDIQGSYWFWPEWTPELSNEIRTLAAGTQEKDVEILPFTWPDIEGTGNELKFWAAITSQDHADIIGAYDFIEWEYF